MITTARILISLLIPALTATLAHAEETIDFSRDVLPILSANCFACHGPDEHDRKANLRLDQEDAAKDSYVDGNPIVAGKPDESTMIARTLSTDPESVMPPPETNKQLTPQQIDILKRWIASGANWKKHWSFEPIQRPAGTLDDQVLSKLKTLGTELQRSADPYTLVRRLSLDLTGLPPTPELADTFATAPTESAYEELVDDLLNSPQFGEHWARMWLDLARYADTKGYEKDLGRSMWPYRDWVIKAFNDDMPLDQFTLEQLAGDLLPNPSPAQLVATAFHRNTMSNDEGGTDDEEFRIAAVKDRVDSTIQIWMGLTMGCAKCHTHKYDPIPTEEYYKFLAIFNQTEDADRYDDAPRMEVLDENQKTTLEMARSVVRVKSKELNRVKEQAAFAPQTAGNNWLKLQSIKVESQAGASLSPQDDSSITAQGTAGETDKYTVTADLAPGRYTALRLEALLQSFDDGQLGVGRNPADPNFVVSEITCESLADPTTPKSIKLSSPIADFAQQGWPVTAAIDGDAKTGWAISPRQRENHTAIFIFESPLEISAPTNIRISLDQQYGNRLILSRFRLSLSDSDPTTLKTTVDTEEVKQAAASLAEAQNDLERIQGEIAQLPIMRELASERQRETRIHQRGNFRDPGEKVTPALLTGFHADSKIEKIDRVAVARWLVHQDNTLTARVWVNRIWSRLFGLGIVETEEDFGALGAQPFNQPLLDWLADDYRRNGWSTKKLLKTIVMSETYRQASHTSDDLRKLDPRNLYTSRGGRFRLTAEVVRDQALAASGLLSTKMGGPAVMPPQPSGLWRSTYNGKKWIDAEGEDRFRRGIYTYLKRTTPYPSFTNFDAGSGEVCLIRRVRTNTPLQALITLNDPVYLEAAASLANRMLEASTDRSLRATRGLRLALIRPASPNDLEPLLSLQQDAQGAFQKDKAQAEELIRTARGKLPEGVSSEEYAAWILTASAILNLDEFLSRN